MTDAPSGVRVTSALPRHFAQVPVALLTHPDTRPNHIALFAALHSLVDWNRDGSAAGWAGRSEVVARAGFSNPRQLYNAREWLRDKGFLDWQERDGAPTEYTLTVPEDPYPNRVHPPAEGVPKSGTGGVPKSAPPPVPDLGTQPDTLQTQEPNNPKTSMSATVVADAPRPEVEQLCTLLADLIEGNGSKRPRITKRWRDACRLMLDRDERTPQQVEAAIRWCQADEFWRANILSMPKLREQYDRLRLAAQRQRASGPAHASDVAARYDAIADELDRRERTTR